MLMCRATRKQGANNQTSPQVGIDLQSSSKSHLAFVVPLFVCPRFRPCPFRCVFRCLCPISTFITLPQIMIYSPDTKNRRVFVANELGK